MTTRSIGSASNPAGYAALCLVLLCALLAPQSARADRDQEPTRLARAVLWRTPEPVLDQLPHPLSRSDTRLYRRIFALQEQGRFGEADRLIRQLSNRLLLGHVLAQRYLHPTAYRSRYGELRAWLEHYADHPQARRIYRLALKRRPEGAPPPPRPVSGYLDGAGQESGREYRLVDARLRPKQAWLRRMQQWIAQGRMAAAKRELQRHGRRAGRLARDIGRWILARGYLFSGQAEQALRLVAPAMRRSGSDRPGMYWTAGLAAWQLGRAAEAARAFAALAAHGEARGEDRAAAAFWAARAYLVAGEPRAALRMFRIAASASDGFYGLLARATLGWPITFSWDEQGLRGSLLSLLVRFPGSRRALALAQVGQLRLAEAEIRKLAARARPSLLRALAALAEHLALPAAQLRVAQRLRLVDGRRHDGAFFPIPRWQPRSGYRLDRALLWAFVRAESGFDPGAHSQRGAVGLLQLLPRTARALARKRKLGEWKRLGDPEVNLAIGQAYLDDLLHHELVQGNLVHLALAYNAGLSRLGAWRRRLARFADDPLTFMESVPFRESRLHARKVLANLWAYRARLGQPAPSLEALAANAWPRYVALDSSREQADARAHR